MKYKIIALAVAIILGVVAVTFYLNYHPTPVMFPKNFQGYVLKDETNTSGYGTILNYTVYYSEYNAFYVGKNSNISIVVYNISSVKVANALFNHLISGIKSSNYTNDKYINGVNEEENFFFNNGYTIVVEKGNFVILLSSVNSNFSNGIDIIRNIIESISAQ
ncbi:hypothetical protein [Acidianus sp. HS-5]|uniref:hypothetical protein n=1 Tax=Acidianus sp. HS-5 TaxID=2886040 RepID=UPI001F209240|nr:hypothetical protein [Acidianus sp. HS-5]BDC19518.1 hypothetical protein HS5_24080 [Acidianus sp. HS-5]